MLQKMPFTWAHPSCKWLAGREQEKDQQQEGGGAHPLGWGTGIPWLPAKNFVPFEPFFKEIKEIYKTSNVQKARLRSASGVPKWETGGAIWILSVQQADCTMKHVSGKLSWVLDLMMLVDPFQLKIFYAFMGTGFCFAAITLLLSVAMAAPCCCQALWGGCGPVECCLPHGTCEHQTRPTVCTEVCANFHHTTSQLGPPQTVLYSPKFTKANIQRESWYHYMQLDTHGREKPLHHKRKAGHTTAPGKLTFVCSFIIWNAQSYLPEMFLFTWLPPHVDQG